MNRSKLVEVLSRETGLTKREGEEIVKMVCNGIENTLAKGERLEVRGFGSFKVKHYEEYTGRNPRTGEPVKVKPKKLPFFKCGKELKERVDIHK